MWQSHQYRTLIFQLILLEVEMAVWGKWVTTILSLEVLH